MTPPPVTAERTHPSTTPIPFDWYSAAMRTTIDTAGRIVIPKGMREEIGMIPGEVDVYVDGARIVIEPIVDDTFVEEGGLMVIPATGQTLTTQEVLALIDKGRR